MPTAEKTARVAELATAMTEAKAIYLADFTGIDVASVTALRRQLRGAGTDYQVVKNRLAKLAAHDAGIDLLAPHLTGPTAVAFANEDPVAPAKVLDQFIAGGGKLVIKTGYVDGQVLTQDQVRALAKLPSRVELLSRVVGGVQAPLSGFASVLAGVLRKLVGTLAALEESRRTEGGDAAAAVAVQ
jgi:large subunit ribosomal protein L10